MRVVSGDGDGAHGASMGGFAPCQYPQICRALHRVSSPTDHLACPLTARREWRLGHFTGPAFRREPECASVSEGGISHAERRWTMKLFKAQSTTQVSLPSHNIRDVYPSLQCPIHAESKEGRRVSSTACTHLINLRLSKPRPAGQR